MFVLVLCCYMVPKNDVQFFFWFSFFFSKVANLTLYAIALIVFAVTKAETNADVENQVHSLNEVSIDCHKLSSGF